MGNQWGELQVPDGIVVEVSANVAPRADRIAVSTPKRASTSLYTITGQRMPLETASGRTATGVFVRYEVGKN